MMVDFPPPLTPADCDLQAFPFMPLHVARLRDSDLAAIEKPEACWYAVLLWAASWHQIPAASVPDDDVVLAKLCGLGRDVKTFRKFREGSLRGFAKCSDGRLYHPVVAEQALEAWEGRTAFQTERTAAAERQARWREEQRLMCARLRELGVTPPEKASKAALRELLDQHDTRNGDNANTVTTPVTPVTPKTGTGTGTGTGIIEEKSPAPRGHRLPPDFVMPQGWLDWAASERGWGKRDAEEEAAGFSDFWHAKAGKDAVKLDWQATWRNWVRNSRRAASVLPLARRGDDEPELPAYA